MLNGLDLFSGIGGLTIALSEWVRPVAYCEIERYAQGVLLSRMADGDLVIAPIWDDVTTLGRENLPLSIDIIYGGFPCQDISVAGKGAGLEGERSGLFFEIARLIGELKPRFVFLENVPAITSRGGSEVVRTLAALGYDCRWCTLSAAEVGAPHRRVRWWLLAYSNCEQHEDGTQEEQRPSKPELLGYANDHGRSAAEVTRGAIQGSDASTSGQNQASEFAGSSEQRARLSGRATAKIALFRSSGKDVTHANGKRFQRQWQIARRIKKKLQNISNTRWWKFEPALGRVSHGVPHRVDRIKGLGNAVVPKQAREAFKTLFYGGASA